MTWHSVVAVCTMLSGTVSYVTNAVPHNYAIYLTALGFGVTAVDRIALAFEKNQTSKKVS